jgi:MerR family transcriptional regulator/heat shock protein HspR
MDLVSEDSADRSGLGVYGISVAAELSGIGEQSLRLYEQRNLISPARTAGGTRRYSDDDLARLQRITELLAAGVNVAGIGQILDLQDRNTQLESDNTALRTDNKALKSDNVRLASTQRRAGAPDEDDASR